jgi:hypothetical protein
MPIPNQQFTIQDHGLGLTEPATSLPLFYGRSSLGTANVLTTVSSVNALVAAFGQGPMVESAAYTLRNGGGPVRCMKSDNTVAGANTAVTSAGGGPAMTVAGTPNDFYITRVRIRSGGILGVATFDYTLDNQETWSEIFLVPAGGTFAVPDTGLTLTFPAGTHISGATHDFTSTPPMWNATDLSAGLTAITASPIWWDFFVGCGAAATATAGAVLAAALQAGLVSLANVHRYKAGIMDTGIDSTANVLTQYLTVDANRVGPAYGWVRMPSAKPVAGWAKPRLRLVDAVARQASIAVLSTDLGRVASGALPGVDLVQHDEFVTELLDAARITTARSYPGEPGVSGLDGYYLTNGRLKSAAGSDFQYWQYRRIMDVACATVYAEQAQMINEDFDVNSDGTIADTVAERWRDRVLEVLANRLTRVKTASGSSGFVQAMDYQIDRTVPLTSSQTIVTEVAIQPKGYGKFIRTQIGFVPKLFLEAA